MQVQQGNREKKIAKFGVSLIRFKLGKRGTVEYIHQYLMQSGLTIQLLTQYINKTGSSINSKYQREKIIHYGELGLFLLLNHPDFRSITLTLINGLTKYTVNEDELPEIVLTKTEITILNKAFQYTASKIMKGRYVFIHSDMAHCGNLAVRLLNNSVIEILNQVAVDDNLKASVMVLFEVGLWTMYCDTAYRDAFFWCFNKIAEKEFTDLIKKHPIKLVKPPKAWYPNVYDKGVKLTKEQQESGELSPGEFSEIEKLCVPKIQERLLNKGR